MYNNLENLNIFTVITFSGYIFEPIGYLITYSGELGIGFVAYSRIKEFLNKQEII